MSELKFMWRLPAYPTEGSRRVIFVSQIMAALEYVQEQGRFQGAFLDDHFLPWTAVDHPGGRDGLPKDTDTLECWTSLTYLAAAFPKLVLGPIVLSQSYRNPALVAKMGATLQLLTHGRFVMGLGTGWHKEDYSAYGYPFPEKPADRIAQLEETIQIIRLMWTESPATFQGRFYQIDSAYCEPRPDPMPPILIGGGGEKLMLRLVARYADWWNYCDTAEAYAHKLDVLRAHCDGVGRDYDSIVKTWDGLQVAVAETERQAKRIYTESHFKRRGSLVGNPEQIAEQLRPFVDLGVTVFFLRFDDFPDLTGLRLFTEAVIPMLT
ncbi:MAG: LLM class flavin-dependent oxidoreductase [Chloroflexi bacterium]|nr:LLM class flavin-dependent oxidoreductase [Chloroflexota bacterium]